MKIILTIVTLGALLSACATQPPRPATPSDQVAENSSVRPSVLPPRTVTVRRAKAKAALPSAEDILPSVELTKDLLYRYLIAELAEQNGDWRVAYVNMLSMARQTRDPRIARRAAEIALAAKQPDEALSAARLWRELAPQSEEATQYYLSFVIVGNNLAEARPVLQQRLKDASPQERGLTILQMQRQLSSAKDKAAALALLDELLVPYQMLAESHIALAQAAFGQDGSDRALQAARKAIALKPDSELAALTLAQILPNKDESVKSLSTFLAAYPKSRSVRLAYARMLVEQTQYEAARREFQTLLKDQPNDLTALYALGLLSVQSKDLKSAENYLTTYLGLLAASPDEDRDPTQALLTLAQIAEDKGDTAAALTWLEQVDASSSDAYLSAQVRRARLIAKGGNLPVARKVLADIDADGERVRSQLLVAEAQLLRDADQPQEAMAVLESGLQLYPDNADLLYDYAMVAEKLNQFDVMEKALRKLIELGPTNQHAYNALGYSLAARNIRLDEALALIEKALQLAPEDPFIMDSMGWVQFRLGRIKEAEDLLRRAYAIQPDPEIAVHLGEVLWVKGQREDAKKFWRDANTKDPKNDTLKSTLARLHVQL